MAKASLEDISANDRIIIVMGLTGAGKSTFIETVTGQGGGTVGHGLRSRTLDVQWAKYIHPTTGQPILFVDTPGFDDTSRPDIDILTMVSDFLIKSYKRKLKLAGIIYLHRISDNRMNAAALNNVSVFAAMCGQSAMPNVVLSTTCWSEVRDYQRAVRREGELCEIYWREMLEGGTKYMRFESSPDSAWTIANSILEKGPCPSLALQREMADENQPLPGTKAAAHLKKPPTNNILGTLTKKIRKIFGRALR